VGVDGEHKLLQHQRWFRRGEKWQTGSGGKNQHAQTGLEGMRRWAGLGVMAEVFIQMGCYLARQNTTCLSPLASRTRMDTRHRRLYPFRAMLPGLCQKVHFCDGK
jgi:hypothetical protein